MRNLCIKNLLILYFIITLFFIKTGISYPAHNYSRFNHNTVLQLVANLNNNSEKSSLLAVGAVTGEAIAGFTLAEVLITLLVIGIVSSIVIPGLIQDTQEMEYKQAFRKVYSDIAQAAMRYKQDNGGTIPINKTTTWYDSAFNPITSYLNVQKNCHASQCFNTSSTPTFNYKSLNDTNEAAYDFDDGQRILANGVFLSSEYSLNLIWVDVNGFIKGPNIVGKDIFGIVVTPTGITPAGSSASGISTDTCSKTYNGTYAAYSGPTSSAGWGCAALVMQGKDY